MTIIYIIEDQYIIYKNNLKQNRLYHTFLLIGRGVFNVIFLFMRDNSVGVWVVPEERAL